MKTLRLYMFSVMSLISIASVQSQDWLSTYGPGSPAWCWQFQQQNNMIDMMNMQMQTNISSFYQNQYNAVTNHIMNHPTEPLPGGILTYEGVYITPETVDSHQREQVDCDHCDGGFNYRKMSQGGGRQTTVKIRCSFCRGKGYVIRTVKSQSSEKEVSQDVAKGSETKSFTKTRNKCTKCSCSGYWGYKHQNGTYEGSCSNSDQYGHKCGHGPEKHGLRKW